MPLVLALLLLAGSASAQTQRVADLTTRPGDVPVRLVGYGLVVGLEGTGDRSFGGVSGATHTVRSVVNLLRRFNVVVPPEHLRVRNVAAVLVTAEVSPYLRAGGRFEIQVASVGDAASLRGGVLWMTPLVSDPDQPPLGTAQGPVLVSDDGGRYGLAARRGTSARIPDGGVIELDPPAPRTAGGTRLQLRRPDLGTAARIAEAVNGAFGAGTAQVLDPGAIALNPGDARADNVLGFLAAVDTIGVVAGGPARIMIDARTGAVVAGGAVQVGPAAVSLRGLTLKIGGADAAGEGGGVVSLAPGATAQEVATGLHAAGAKPDEVMAVFDALRAVGALTAEVVVR